MFWGLDKLSQVMARANLSLSVGLTVLPKVVGSEDEVQLSAKWRKSQNHCRRDRLTFSGPLYFASPAPPTGSGWGWGGLDHDIIFNQS